MNKSEIRKKIIKLRKKKYSKSLSVNEYRFLNFLRNKKSNKKIIGGYYPYNYELDIINLLKELEKKNIQFLYLKLIKIIK